MHSVCVGEVLVDTDDDDDEDDEEPLLEEGVGSFLDMLPPSLQQ